MSGDLVVWARLSLLEARLFFVGEAPSIHIHPTMGEMLGKRSENNPLFPDDMLPYGPTVRPLSATNGVLMQCYRGE